MARALSEPRRALILGGIACQIDAIKSLQSHGWEVHACGQYRDEPASIEADDFHVLDFLDIEAVTNLADQLKVHLIFSVGSDVAMSAVIHASERLDLPHFVDSTRAEVLRDKALLREFLDNSDISPVDFRRVQSVEDLTISFPYPGMLKPTDSQGQRGLAFVRSSEEARQALPSTLSASPSGSAILEEYLSGPEVSVHVFLVDGEIVFFEPSDRHLWSGALPGVAQKHVMPSKWAGIWNREGELLRLVDTFIKALGIANGPLYFQVKLTEFGPRIVEVAPRLDGCHLWRLIQAVYGIDLLRACWSMLATGTAPDLSRQTQSRAATLSFHLVAPRQPVDVTALRSPGSTGSRGVIHEQFFVKHQDMPRNPNGHICKAGYRITLDHSTEQPL